MMNKKKNPTGSNSGSSYAKFLWNSSLAASTKDDDDEEGECDDSNDRRVEGSRRAGGGIGGYQNDDDQEEDYLLLDQIETGRNISMTCKTHTNQNVVNEEHRNLLRRADSLIPPETTPPETKMMMTVSNYGTTATTTSPTVTSSSSGSLTKLGAGGGGGSTVDYGYDNGGGSNNKDGGDDGLRWNNMIIYPWSNVYQLWWIVTVVGAILTTFFETYQIGFASSTSVTSPYFDEQGIPYMEYILTVVFGMDMILNYNYIAYYREDSNDHELITDRTLIRSHYLYSRKFYIDLIALLPFQFLLLLLTRTAFMFLDGSENDDGGDTTTLLVEYLAFVRLFRLLRLYRVIEAFDLLAVDTRISLMTLTLIRNFSAALLWTHVAACTMYFMARVTYNLDVNNTFLGSKVVGMNDFQRYITSLYWSTVTFATVGYGDFVAVNTSEQTFSVLYMLSNIVIQAWIIGSITLLLIKKDEKTGEYRDTLETLDQYSQIHNFESNFQRRLKNQLRLDFTTREIADESVLRYFPASIRRKVLRRLYMPHLIHTDLMKNVRQQFVDAFLTTSRVEIFGPGEEILRRNAISSDLYLLVGGNVQLIVPTTSSSSSTTANDGGVVSNTTSNTYDLVRSIQPGHFINEIGFFTETPQIETIRTVTVCKTVTMSRSSYKLLAQDHPGSAGKILQNLLRKVESMANGEGGDPAAAGASGGVLKLPQPMGPLRAGSVFYDPMNDDEEDDEPSSRSTAAATTKVSSILRHTNQQQPHDQDQLQESQPVRSMMKRNISTLVAVQEIVKMHINKQKDDHTTRFLFSASRDDVNTITVMCDQGFDVNSCDYDNRTALMVASMKGNIETVTKLLEEYHANPNLIDMHGSTALYEATKNGHVDIMKLLLRHGGTLNMSESLAASILDQAVFDGDIVLLRRLLEAKIYVNAADYDKRAAVHIAAAEGNLAALKTMVEFGADLSLRDRWGNTVEDEAKRAKAGKLLDYLKYVKQQQRY